MRKLQIVGSMILIGALGVPVVGLAQDQDRDRDRDRSVQTDRDHDRDRARLPQSDRDEQGRIYDPYRRDYHAWDANEQRYYGQWANAHHYRDYNQLKRASSASTGSGVINTTVIAITTTIGTRSIWD
jgi:hypothetical protein